MSYVSQRVTEEYVYLNSIILLSLTKLVVSRKTTCDLSPVDICSSEFLTIFYFFFSKDKTQQGDFINEFVHVQNFSNLMQLIFKTMFCKIG